MALSSDLRKLVKALIDPTDADRVNWLSDHKKTYSIVFPRSSLRIWEYEDPNGETGISIELINDRGERAALDSIDVGEPDYNLVHHLYERASRKSARIDEALQDAIAEILKPDGRIGRPPDPPPDEIPF